VSVGAERGESRDPASRGSGEEAIGRLVKGRYRIVRLLGRGAMGNVYEAVHERLHSSFALKQLRAELDDAPGIADRFRHEAEMMAKVAHPNVARVFDIDSEPGFGTWIAMELVHGETLATVLRARGALPVADVLRIAAQIAAALDCAHRAGLVHRDIKPANVLIEAVTGRAVLTDFGIAKSLAGQPADATATGVFLGTYRYSSPEQLRNRRGVELDGRADVYSLGVVLYEMLTGRRFLDGYTESEILEHVGFDPAWTPPLVYDEPPPPELEALIARCLAPRREDRIASVRELAEQLAACGASGPPTRTGDDPRTAHLREGRAPLPALRSRDASAPVAAPDPTAATVLVPARAEPGDDPAPARPTPAGRGTHAPLRRARLRAVVATVGVAALLLFLAVGADLVPEPASEIAAWLGLRGTIDGIEIDGVVPESKLVTLTRREPMWFSVVLQGVDPAAPPTMRWYLNQELVAEGTTVWEYEPATYLEHLVARGTVRFEVDGGRRRHQNHTWKTQTPLADLSPVLLSASAKPGSTITARPGEVVTISVDVYDPDGTPLGFTWRIDGKPAGGDEPRLRFVAARDVGVSLVVSDGEASVSSGWKVVVTPDVSMGFAPRKG